jgi:hypothetical protein
MRLVAIRRLLKDERRLEGKELPVAVSAGVTDLTQSRGLNLQDVRSSDADGLRGGSGAGSSGDASPWPPAPSL